MAYENCWTTACRSYPLLHAVVQFFTGPGDGNDSDLKKIFEKPEAFRHIQNARSGKTPTYFSSRGLDPFPVLRIKEAYYAIERNRLEKLHKAWRQKAFNEICQFRSENEALKILSSLFSGWDYPSGLNDYYCKCLQREIDEVRNLYYRYRAINYLKRYGKVEHESKS